MDATKSTKVQLKEGGDELVVGSGGKITLEAGAVLEVNGKNVTPEVEALDGTSTIFGAAGTPVDGVQASLVLDSAAANADLTLTAVEYGVSGHTITAEIVQGVGNNIPLAVGVNGRDISIFLPTDGAGAPVAATATEVKAAYDAVPAAVALATCAKEGTGAGTVDEAAVAPFAGGVDVTPGGVPSFKVAAAGDFLFVKVAAQTWKKVALAAL